MEAFGHGDTVWIKGAGVTLAFQKSQQIGVAQLSSSLWLSKWGSYCP
jgi:hypothetical protein